MAMQTDVKSAHLNQSGVMYNGRTRLRGMTSVATATAGTVNLWDALVAPTAATYARAGYTVTVTLASHGFAIGQVVGLTYAAGGATNGNYVIQAAGFTSGAFTVTDLNTGTVAALSNCSVSAGLWMMSYDTAAATEAMVSTLIPGQGIVANTGIYAQMTNQTGLTIYYG